MVYPVSSQTTLAPAAAFTNYNENLIQHPQSPFAESLQIEDEKANYNKLVLYVEHTVLPPQLLVLF